jgi:hypothetical protein
MFLNKLFSISNKSKEFWFSHVIVLLGTVFGVYIAASAGLKTAIEFELIKSDRDSYFMRSALLEELKDNINTIETWGKEYRGGNARKFIGKPKDFHLDTYVWITMQDNPGTFEIPAEILTTIRRYYRKTEVGLAKMTSHQPAANDVDKMIKDSQTMRKKTVVLLIEDIKALKNKLVDFDIKL